MEINIPTTSSKLVDLIDSTDSNYRKKHRFKSSVSIHNVGDSDIYFIHGDTSTSNDEATTDGLSDKVLDTGILLQYSDLLRLYIISNGSNGKIELQISDNIN